MGKKKRGAKRGLSSQEKYRKGLRERKELEAFEATLSSLKCSTFLRTNSKLMISKEGVCVHKRSLWKDGKYLGLVHRIICNEEMADKLEIPDGLWGFTVPKDEYEFKYQSREELERQRVGLN